MPLPIVLQIPTRNKPRRRNGSVSICRSSRTETGRGACTAASTPIMGRSSTQHCPRLANDCSARATTTSRGPMRWSTSPNRSFVAAPAERRERFRINLFMDPAQSATATWINGIAVPDSIARLCLCDGTISPVFFDEARPVSVGRSQRIVPERTRRIVVHRDKQCRNPLCGARRGLEVHHIIHWSDGGTTDTWNLVTLCRRCHRDHHLGHFDLSGNADDPDGVVFRDVHGRVTDTATHAAKPPGPPPTPLRPYRHPLGERLQRWAIQFNSS